MAFVRSVACLLIAAAMGAAQIPIEFAVPSVVATAPINDQTVADVFGTAHPEIIVMTPTSTVVILDHHDPNQTTVTLNLPSPGRSCVVADLDGDGDRDLAVTCGTLATPVVSVFLANSGNYARVDYSGGVPESAIEAADADGDGDLDLLNGGSLFVNNGAGTLTPTALAYAFGGTLESRFGDIDGDGDSDIVGLQIFSGATTFKWQVLRRDPGGVWTPKNPVTITGAKGRLGLADMNGNGRCDVVVYYERDYQAIRFRTYFGTSSGSVTSPVEYELAANFNPGNVPSTKDFKLGDLDQDGDVDVAFVFRTVLQATPNVPSVVLAVLANQGTGTFEGFPGVGVARISPPSNFTRLTLADDDLDGKLDLIGGMLLSGTGGVRIAHAISPSPTSVLLTSTLSSGVTAWAASAFVEYPFTAQLSDGTPARGHIVEPSFSGIAGPITVQPTRAVVDDLGGTSIEFSSGPTQGTLIVSATTASGGLYVSPTHYVGPTLTIVSGTGQTLCTNMPSPQPLVVRYEWSPGQPLVGATIVFYSLSGPIATFSPAAAVTDANGLVSTVITPSISNPLITIAVADSTSTTYLNFTVVPTLAFEKISGDLQTTPASEPFAQPLVVQLHDCYGSPISGTAVTFSVVSPVDGAILSTPTTSTDASGFAQTLVTAGTTVGPVQIRATVAGLPTVMFSLTVTPRYSLSAFSGQDQVSVFGHALSAPLVLQLLRFDGQPEAGVPIQFTLAPQNSSLTLSATSVSTDSQGRAAITVLGHAHEGDFNVVASTTAGTSATFHGFFRRLRNTQLATSNFIIYRHEHPFVPLIIAADVPLPAPGFFASPFGDISTSILAPSPNLVVLDGLGVFGPPDPTVATLITGDWSRSIARPNPPLGITYVVQVYGYDAAYLGLDAYFISNAILVTL